MKTNKSIMARATLVFLIIGSSVTLAQLANINVGTGAKTQDGDTVRTGFIKANNNFTWIGGQLDTLNSEYAGLGSTFDPIGLGYAIGLNCTNYTFYAVGTNTVAWLGCLNLESNVLQSDVTALTNNVNNLWATLGGTTVLHPGDAMAFDRATASPYSPQITSDGSGNLTVNGSIHGSYLSDSYSSTPAVGYVATSQGTDGTWQWQALPVFPTTLNFDSGNISSDGSGNAYFVSIQAQQLKDTGGSTGNSGNYPQANGSGGWNWTAWPTTLNYDSGTLTSDGNGNMTATSVKAGLTDGNGSSGNSGYLPVASGSGGWTWTQGNVVPDSGGNGGTCLQLKASDNGAIMYLHVNSSGDITVTETQ